MIGGRLGVGDGFQDGTTATGGAMAGRGLSASKHQWRSMGTQVGSLLLWMFCFQVVDDPGQREPGDRRIQQDTHELCIQKT
jgi:hypothetical protein